MNHPSLFDQVDDNRRKKPTRFRLEFFDAENHPIWDALVTEMPPAEILTALHVAGITFRRPIIKGDPDRHLVYSHLDPSASIAAAREFMGRRTTKRGNVLRLLLDRGGWVARDEIRRVGGDSGDRRVRELRQDGWPIEIRQERDGEAWQCRLNLPGATR